ncbi:MAG: ABC transporter substrate-binding protein, partial [Deltaproteobacteria bacterium]|nr:ABC transporter substrate-binding protein [Deltaproteobacteria bacterium]
SVEGADIVVIASVIPIMPYYLMVKPEIRSVEDLRGKLIGVARFGSATDQITRKVLQEQWNLVPMKDYFLIQMGSDREILGGLLQEKIAGGMLGPPAVFIAEKHGFRTLISIPSLNIPYIHSGVTTRRDLIKKRPEIVGAFMKAYVEGVALYLRDREFSMNVVSKYLGQQSPEILVKSYDWFVKHILRVPYPQIEGIQTFLQQISGRSAQIG